MPATCARLRAGERDAVLGCAAGLERGVCDEPGDMHVDYARWVWVLMGHVDGCAEPECVICQWICDAMIRFNDRMKEAIIASAEAEALVVHVNLWLPPIPHRENRRLPMPLKYAT